MSLEKSPDYLSEFIQGLTIKEIINFNDFIVKNVTDNSKNIDKNSIFVAIEGYKYDGHNFCQEAITNGAKAIIGEKKKSFKNATYIRVENTRKALAKLLKKLYNWEKESLKLIGVTGSTGKTTTTMMIESIIKNKGFNTAVMGSLYTKIGKDYYKNPNDCTTPSPRFIQKSIKEIKNKDINHLTMEVSSHGLKLDRVWGLEYDIGVFTNLSYDHMKFHNSINDYYQSKKKLFSLLGNNAISIINKDDKIYSSLSSDISSRYFSYGIKSNSDFTATNIEQSKSGIKFEININNKLKTKNRQRITPKSIRLNIPVLGFHNVYNVLAACACGIGLGYTLESIKKGLKNFTGIRRRMEIIYDNDITIIDDYAHNPASLTANFDTLDNFDYNNLIIVHFLKGNRGVKANKINAKIISRWSKKLNIKNIITTRSEEFIQDKNKVLRKEEKAFTDVFKGEEAIIQNYRKLTPALNKALAEISKNDLLLLLGGPGLNKGKAIIEDLLNQKN